MTDHATGGPRLRVRVPASTSNLGPGFDLLGMAVDLYLEAEFRPGSHPLTVTRSGASGGETLTPERDGVLQALSETVLPKPLSQDDLADDLGALPRGRLNVTSEIPLGRGLGSSAAALVTGRVLGLLLSGETPQPRSLLAWVTEREGHPDNAAPAILGGLVASQQGVDGTLWTQRLPVSPELAWIYAAPTVPLDTATARAALPNNLPLGAAVRNAGRLLRLLEALRRGDGPALASAMEDEFHVPYRLPLIPGGVQAVEAGRDAGAWSVTISGAGSGLMAVAPHALADAVGRAMAQAFQAVPEARGGFYRRVLPVEEGAQWEVGGATDAS